MALGVIKVMLQFETVVATGSPALDSGIGDTALKTFNGDTYLYSVTGPFGGVAAWRLTEGAGPQLVDTVYHSGPILYQVGRTGVPITLGAEDQLALDINNATGLVGYTLNADGTFGDLQETGTLVGGGDISAMTQLAVGGQSYLTLAHEETDQIGSYEINPGGTLSVVSLVSGQADSMHAATVGSEQFVITANAANSEIAVFDVSASDGSLSALDNSAAVSTMGISTPTAIEVVEAYGQSWVIVAGSGSNSLSVMGLRSDGRLIPKDHVLDTLNTRFESVQDLSVIEVNGRAFVVAGGSDDGVSLFTLTPNGKLVYLDSFADTLDSGLGNVQTLNLAHIGDELQVLATSQQDPGLTQLSVSLANLGVVLDGSGPVMGTAQDDMLSAGVLDAQLSGGAGDDILIAGSGETTLTGGAGADIFVMQYGSDPTTITDFEAGTDRLDMFDYLLLRTPDQLTFTATSQGADIQYLNEVVHVISSTGTPLTKEEVFGSGFGGPDHIPVDFGTFGGLEPASSDGIQGRVSVDSETANPGLADAEIKFTPTGGGTVTATTDETGRFDLNVPNGTLAGELEVVKTYSTASGRVNALDALQVLRISVGLDPTWGPAAPENLIAADITQDGAVNALDALSILQAAVGQTSPYPAKWVFLDADADLSGITRDEVNYDTQMDVTVQDGSFAVDMTSILLGNIESL